LVEACQREGILSNILLQIGSKGIVFPSLTIVRGKFNMSAPNQASSVAA
jgi:hypothetical protein